MADKIQLRRDTAANWTSANPTLAQGEPGYEIDTGRVKVGDGTTPWNALGYSFEADDHGTLSGLGDDDHPQYLNEARHDALPFDNPHNVDKTQVGLSNVPNIDATDRANHTGTQLASTISDFNAAVQAAETQTTLTVQPGNILRYIGEDGTNQDVDLNPYLDDTNLARIVSGTLDTGTGILTVTRDDSSTFTIDLSALLDNQNASEVPVTPVGNLTSTDAQGALVELQGDIDSLNTTTGSLQSQITANDGDILTLQSQQTVQDAAIALNTAKVSADGSVGTHNDVDITGVQTGDQLEWNGSQFIPKAILNGFTIFPIWAEENGGLANGAYEWSWGNGAVGADIGIPLGLDCELFAVSFNAETFGTSVSIDTEINGVAVNTSTFTANNTVQNFTAVSANAGDRVGFRTNTVNGGMSDARVCAWFRVQATAAFPTPDRSVVSNSSVAFTSTSFATIPGMSTTVTLSSAGTVDGFLNYSALRSGATNSISQFRVVINGNNGQTFFDTLSTFNDTGSCAHFVESLPAGTYTVEGQALVDQPITITSVSLTATAVED